MQIVQYDKKRREYNGDIKNQRNGQKNKYVGLNRFQSKSASGATKNKTSGKCYLHILGKTR